jgi:hypothetical protein
MGQDQGCRTQRGCAVSGLGEELYQGQASALKDRSTASFGRADGLDLVLTTDQSTPLGSDVNPLPDEPHTFREVVEADLRRAARLLIKTQSEIDPQLRISTPEGDYGLSVTLPEAMDERLAILRSIATFMAWKQALGFTLASELVEPDSVYCVGVARRQRHACLAQVRRYPQPWTADNFDAIEWLPESSIDPVIADLLPLGPTPVTPKAMAAAEALFGKAGRFPAVLLTTGAVRGLI